VPSPRTPHQRHHDDLDPNEIALISLLVRDFLATRPRFPLPANELEQDATIHWWQQQHHYDAARGASRKTFLRHVVRNRLLDIERRLQTDRRRGAFALSLDKPNGPDADAPTLGDLLVSGRDLATDVALRDAIARVEADLTPRQRALAHGLKAGESMTELSATLGVSRETAYQDRRRIAALLRKQGLDTSFPGRP